MPPASPPRSHCWAEPTDLRTSAPASFMHRRRHGLWCDMRAGRVWGRQIIEKANTMRPIDRFLSLVGAEVSAAATDDARSAGSRVAALLAEAPTPADTLPPQRLAVCQHLAAACAGMRPDLAAAFKA